MSGFGRSAALDGGAPACLPAALRLPCASPRPRPAPSGTRPAGRCSSTCARSSGGRWRRRGSSPSQRPDQSRTTQGPRGVRDRQDAGIFSPIVIWHLTPEP